MENLNQSTPDKQVTTPSKNNDENMWPMLCHLSGLCGLLIPLGNILAPLIILLVKQDSMPEIRKHAFAALNFQISVSIYLIVPIILVITIPLAIAGGVAAVVITIIAALKARDGILYKYPLTIQFMK